MKIILDTETTGLTAGKDELLQVSIIDENGRTIIDSYVKPTSCTEWPEAMAVNHITPEMVAAAPTIRDAALHDQIQAALNAADTIIGYNTEFDLGFLEAAGFDIPDRPQIDVMREFAEVYGEISESHNGYKWQKLTTAAAYYDYQWTIEAHNSLADCFATLYVYNKMRMNVNNLRPCPFCGESKDLMILKDDCTKYYYIMCDDTTDGHGCGATSGYYTSIKSAIAAWNRRAGDKPHGAKETLARLYGVTALKERTGYFDTDSIINPEEDESIARCERCGTYLSKESISNGICYMCHEDDEAESKSEGLRRIDEILKEVLPDETN